MWNNVITFTTQFNCMFTKHLECALGRNFILFKDNSTSLDYFLWTMIIYPTCLFSWYKHGYFKYFYLFAGITIDTVFKLNSIYGKYYKNRSSTSFEGEKNRALLHETRLWCRLVVLLLFFLVSKFMWILKEIEEAFISHINLS